MKQESEVVTCPRCGATAPAQKGTPYCDSCGWNVADIRYPFEQARKQTLLAAPLLALFLWALSDSIALALIVGAVVLAFMLVHTRIELAKLPAPAPQGFLAINPPIGAMSEAKMLFTFPGFKFLAECLIVVACSAGALHFGLGDFKPFQAAHQRLFDWLVTCWFGWVAVVHAWSVWTMLRFMWVEQQIARNGALTEGVVIRRRGNNIEYEFRDQAGELRRGHWADSSNSLYSEMPVQIAFEPSRPELNLPVQALQFHRLIENPGAVTL